MQILLTGATGFVGGAVGAALADRGLLRDTRFAVRADTLAQGLDRIRGSLARFGISRDMLMRISERQIVRFDLRTGPVDPLERSTELVINCAALTTFSSTPSLWETNVDGVLAFAARVLDEMPRLKRFIQVGSAMSCGERAGQHIFENWHVPPEETHVVPYTFSKGMAELALRSQVPDLPLVVVRPSIVVGHTRFGCEPSGSIFWLFRIIAQMEAFTCRLSDHIDVISADDCAEAILLLAFKPKLAYNLYHLSAGVSRAETVTTLYPLLRSCRSAAEAESARKRYRYIEKIDPRMLANKVPGMVTGGGARLALRAVRLYAKFAQMGYVFDNTRLRNETGFVPCSFGTYVHRCIETSQRESIVEQMRWDYR